MWGLGARGDVQAEEPLPKLDSFGMADEVSDATASLSISQSPALPACENVNSPVPTGAYSLGRVGPSSVGTPGGMRSETKRRERTDERSIIYEKLPTDIAKRHVLLLDPILATGNSAKEAINILLNRGVAQSSIILCTLIAAPQGIHAVCSTFPEVGLLCGVPPRWWCHWQMKGVQSASLHAFVSFVYDFSATWRDREVMNMHVENAVGSQPAVSISNAAWIGSIGNKYKL